MMVAHCVGRVLKDIKVRACLCSAGLKASVGTLPEDCVSALGPELFWKLLTHVLVSGLWQVGGCFTWILD